MKKRILILFSIVVLFVSLLISIVNASDFENNTSDNSEKNVKNEDIFNFEENIEKQNEIVNGNAYLMGSDVTIENQIINGDVFICGNNVTIEKDVTINGNVYVVAANLKVDSTITRGLYVVAKDVVINSNSIIKYDANIGADHLIINGSFDRNLNVAVNSFEIKENTAVLQDLSYTSEKEADIENGAEINNIKFNKKIIEKETMLDIIYKYVIDFVQYFILTFVMFIIIMKFMPNFIIKARQCFSVSAFGLGIVSIIILPILFIVLMLLKITASVALAGLMAVFTIIIISMSISNITIASAISNKFSKLKLPISVALVTLISWVIYQIPFFGAIFAFFMVSTGLGITEKVCVRK